MMKRAIVTGPTGAVGLALVNELLDNNIEVTAVVRPHSARAARLESNVRLDIIEMPLQGLRQLPSKAKGEYDAFYHLAWDYSRDHDNVDKQLDNVRYTLDSVYASKELGCKTFIGAGSQAEYGAKGTRIREESVAAPATAYGIAKLCAGMMSRKLCSQLGISHVWPRIFSIYGPGDAETTMVISTIRKIINGQSPPFSGGEQQWDYLYSEDCARALRLIGEKGKDGKIYNIASGEMHVLRWFIETIRDEINPEILVKFGDIPYKKDQVMKLDVDISSLVYDTGFKPQISFHEGIRKTIKWCRSNQVILKPEERGGTG